MKRFILSLWAMACVVGAHAYDYPWLTFRTNAGTETSVLVDGLSISIADGYLVLTNAAGTRRLALSSLSSMQFADTATGLPANARQEKNSVRVFTTDGIMLGEYDDLAEARARLPRGIYIGKSGTGTLKILKR